MRTRSLVPHAAGGGISDTQTQAIRSVPGALLNTALPALPRRPMPDLVEAQAEQQAVPQAQQQGFRSLVSAACYLSFVTGGDPESVLDAIQILHDLSTELRDASEEDRIWETARNRWERQRLIDVAVRFVKSPRATLQQQPRRAWQRFRAAWRRNPSMQPF